MVDPIAAPLVKPIAHLLPHLLFTMKKPKSRKAKIHTRIDMKNPDKELVGHEVYSKRLAVNQPKINMITIP